MCNIGLLGMDSAAHLRDAQKGLERWLSSQEHLWLSERSQIYSPPPTRGGGGSQLPLTSVPGDLSPSTGGCTFFCTDPHTHTQKHT